MNGSFMGLPIGQINAHLSDEMVMRVGIPHRGGKLAFNACTKEYAAMVSANAFWSQTKQEFSFPEYTDLSELDFAMDSAGYVAMLMLKKKGKQAGMAGIFPWSMSQYVEFATSCGSSWWSQPDLCVEPELAGSEDEIQFRIKATATLLEGALQTLYAWQNELVKTCSARTIANMLKPPVPVIQGWDAAHYEQSLELMTRVWERWEPWLGAPALIGVGSVCRRSLKHPTHGLYAVLERLRPLIPQTSRLHLFGVKGGCLGEMASNSWIASADSMAFDLGARIKAHQRGHSNSMVHRCAEMDRWMRAALARISTGSDARIARPVAI